MITPLGEKYTRNEWGRCEKYTRNEWGRCEKYTRNEWGRCEKYSRNECGRYETTLEKSGEDVKLHSKQEEKM
jgi:hypothetical protein